MKIEGKRDPKNSKTLQLFWGMRLVFLPLQLFFYLFSKKGKEKTESG